MAGMLPGVELARRRRIHSHQFDHDRYPRCNPFLPESIKPLSTATATTTTTTTTATATATATVTTMDATALKARTRLEEKLRSRWIKHAQPSPVQLRSSSHVLWSKQLQRSETETRARETEVYRNSPQLSRRNSQREVCAVCLDELQGLREITNLPCSHKYHSDCLLPWLASHSHCPCCRSLVQSL